MRFPSNFFLETWINGSLRYRQGIPDPFARVEFNLSWRDRLLILLGRKFVFYIRGNEDRNVVTNVMSVLDLEPEAEAARKEQKGT